MSSSDRDQEGLSGVLSIPCIDATQRKILLPLCMPQSIDGSWDIPANFFEIIARQYRRFPTDTHAWPRQTVFPPPGGRECCPPAQIRCSKEPRMRSKEEYMERVLSLFSLSKQIAGTIHLPACINRLNLKSLFSTIAIRHASPIRRQAWIEPLLPFRER